ncbi:U7 snRNA-associated Sm-like protein LSm11 isoform X2 [Carcharodon carcharias]|uniref:U7 snRNA-associated Sm-like protein LSm11 isoform X2 n=1 Tax=Carcharodon carcharias TaxID=13397 RepID=UPI001B7F0054|nr:U7 snRNA-associated Sm-like protein LSm11 isoform X2 [Carcharodon carcharias]
MLSACNSRMAAGESALSRQRIEMAEGGQREEAGAREEEEDSGLLDVSSPRFDPYLALYSRRQPPLPFPNVRTFNNMAEYQSFLSGRRDREAAERTATNRKGRGRRAASARPPPDPDRIERLKKLMVAEPSGEERPRPRRRDRAPKNVLTRMALHEGSPLGELYRCVQDRIKINVHIRTFKGLRGICSGFLVTFDKFWNMALVDVDETFRKPILGKAFYNEPTLTVSRLFDRLKLQEGSADEESGATTTKQKRCLSKRFEGAKGGLDDSCVFKAEPMELTPETLKLSARSEAVDPDQSKRNAQQMSLGLRTLTGEKQKKKARPRVDYQQVSQRHVKQLFIRGENILLISLMQ